jgi:hypothetical protein
LRFRGRRRRCDPRSAPAGTVAGAWAVVAVDIAGGKTSAASGVSGVRMAGGMLDRGQKRKRRLQALVNVRPGELKEREAKEKGGQR